MHDVGRRGPGARHDHPALRRFLLQRHPQQRLLLVHAPANAGRKWFAADWIRHMGGDGDPIVWPPDEDLQERLQQLTARLDASPDEPLAVIVPVDAAPAPLIGQLDCRFAAVGDLLLREPEIATLIDELGAQPGLDAGEIHRLTGGWLPAVESLIHHPGDRGAARRTLGSALIRWVAARDPGGAFAETAFLARFSEEILVAFEPSDGQPSPRLDELIEEGLVQHDDDGEPFMPELVRAVLQDLVRSRGTDVTERVVGAAAEALSTTGHVDDAVESAMRHRAWGGLQRILYDVWADLFTSDARKLRSLTERMPRFLRDRSDVVNVMVRIIASAGPDRMILPLPTVEPDISRDRTAQRLRERTDNLYSNPDSRSLSIGLLEIGHLRLAGHFVEAAEAASRLRRAVAEARRASPTLQSLAELHAGMSFHLADQLSEAGRAYEAALFLANSHGHNFLTADALSKLALLHAHRGNAERSRRLIDELQEPLSRIGWGKAMLARAGTLAEAWVAVLDLDLDHAERVLGTIPEKPDSDEFWSLHTVLLAHVLALRGNGRAALRLIAEQREERPFAAAAPLARRVFREAEHGVHLLMGSPDTIDGWQDNPTLANLEALRRLRTGAPDAALSALPEPAVSGGHQENLAEVIGMLARDHTADGRPAESTLQELARLRRTREGQLGDLMPLHILGHSEALHEAGIIDDDEFARLDAIPPPEVIADPRPTLTQRENQLLGLLREGLTRKQMAEVTFLSENTIKTHLRALYGKLGTSSAKEALERARTWGF